MRIIARQTLKQFWLTHEDAEAALTAWYHEAKNARWKSPADIKKRYPSADIVGENRVVFNIKGNTYRLVVKIHYDVGVIYIRFVGTHAEYNKINAESI